MNSDERGWGGPRRHGERGGEAFLGALSVSVAEPLSAPKRSRTDRDGWVWSGAPEELHTEVDNGGDLLEVVVEGDQRGLVVEGQGRNQEIERAGVKALLAAGLSEFNAPGPHVARSREQRKGFELPGELLVLLRCGVTQNLKHDRFRQMGGGIEDVRRDKLLEAPGRSRPGEIDPQTGIDEGDHSGLQA